MKAHGEKSGLTFHWPDARHVSFVLPGFIALSILVHALAFGVLQVEYPKAASIALPPAQVSLLEPSTPEKQAFLKWIDAQDPALNSKPADVLPPDLVSVPYEPTYAKSRTQPKSPPEEAVSVSFPPAESPAAIVEHAITAKKPPAVPVPSLPTRVRVSGDLASRKMTNQPSLSDFPVHASTELEPTRFLVGVGERGDLRYSFLQAGCGDNKIDEQAGRRLSQFEFAPGSSSTTWGVITFYWGKEVFAEPAAANQETPSPSPASPVP